MIEFLTVFIIQMVFIFLIDNKYRILHSDDIKQAMMFQGLIALMYIIAIPLIAKGTFSSAIGYIGGSVLGTFLSWKWHKNKRK